jgi:hypothetical protein
MIVWAYKNENGILCCALLQESIPQGVEAIRLEVDSPDDVILDENGNITIKSQEQKLQELKNQKLEYLKKYVYSLLAPTDYVITKISESQLNGFSTSELLIQYQDVLTQRQSIRDWNSQKEQEISNATSIAELNNINLIFE